MMETTIIDYAGAKLEILKVVEPHWRYDLDLEDWPTYCGPSKVGDRLVSDHIAEVKVSPCCFDHDLSFRVLKKTYKELLTCNLRFYKNLRNLVYANQEGHKAREIETKCFAYFFAVSTFGWKCFKDSTNEYADPMQHPEMLNKIYRLQAVKNNR